MKQAIVILLVVLTLVGTYFEITYFHVPYWLDSLQLPDIFELSQFSLQLMRILSHILVFVGVFKLIKLNKIEIVNALKFPIYFFTVSSLFWFITTLLSTEHSYFFLSQDAPFYNYIFKYLDIILFILIIAFHWNSENSKEFGSEKLRVSKSSRFFNWFIDLLVILAFGFQNIRTLAEGSVVEDISYLNSNSNWFFVINIFCYYFILEYLFLQTIGKLHNNSVVEYEGSKLKSILTRTACRFIPFEAFSFFGKKGWHDSLSKTTVVKTTNAHEEPFDGIV